MCADVITDTFLKGRPVHSGKSVRVRVEPVYHPERPVFIVQRRFGYFGALNASLLRFGFQERILGGEPERVAQPQLQRFTGELELAGFHPP